MNIQIHDDQRTTNRMNIKSFIWYIIIKMSKVKEKKRIWKQEEKRDSSHTRDSFNPCIKLSMDFSEEILQAKREWHNIFKVLKEKTGNQEYYTQQSSPSETK